MTGSPPQYTLATADAEPPITWGYWVVEGQFLAGAYPGSLKPDEHRLKVQTLLNAGIRTIINLTEPTERGRNGKPFVPYEPTVRELSEGLPGGVRCLRFPIRDQWRAVRAYGERKWGLILELALERIALLRGQIVHGAATRGSRLNRQSLQRCRKVLEALLPAVLQLVIEHRADDDWPPLCYPPIEE